MSTPYYILALAAVALVFYLVVLGYRAMLLYN